MLATPPCAQSSCIAGQFAYRALFDPKNVWPTHDTVVPSSALPRKPKEVFSPARTNEYQIEVRQSRVGPTTRAGTLVPAATAHTFWQSFPRSQWLFAQEQNISPAS